MSNDDVKRKVGGKGGIKPEDGKQFEAGNKAAEKWTEPEALKLADDIIDWLKDEDKNIFFEDFLYLKKHVKYAGKITPQTISYLSKKFTSFSNLIVIAKKIEEVKLTKYAAFDKMNSGFVKFLLSCNHGKAEKSVVETNNPFLDLMQRASKTDE
ncbi:MAG: hypothetical protein IPO21_14475 [Bacteroidales bacterium]|nr:hypothetical protein [Bacteroidales bacterium]